MSQYNHSKDYLVSIMFSHYDRNNNGNLEATELNEVSNVFMSYLLMYNITPNLSYTDKI